MNIYKATRGKKKVEITAKNLNDAEKQARPLLKSKTTVIKLQYVETLPEAIVTPSGLVFNL